MATLGCDDNCVDDGDMLNRPVKFDHTRDDGDDGFGVLLSPIMIWWWREKGGKRGGGGERGGRGPVGKDRCGGEPICGFPPEEDRAS